MTNAYMGRTTVTELRDRIRKLGATPKGKTKAALLDELEQLIGSGDGSSVKPEDVIRIVDARMASQLPDAIEPAIEDYMESNRGELSDSDLDDIFGGE